MEMKDRLNAALQAGAPPVIRVVWVKRVAGRWLAMVVSKAFEEKSALDRQQLIRTVLDKSPAPLSAAERRSIALFRTFTPAELKAKLTRKGRNARPTDEKNSPGKPQPMA